MKGIGSSIGEKELSVCDECGSLFYKKNFPFAMNVVAYFTKRSPKWNHFALNALIFSMATRTVPIIFRMAGA